RIWDDNRFMKRAYLGCSQYTSKCEIQPWMTTNVIGPSPKSWYAIYAPSTAVAQRVLGITRPSCCAARGRSSPAAPSLTPSGRDGRMRQAHPLRRHASIDRPTSSCESPYLSLNCHCLYG